jgi:hypothetical protein
MHVHITDYHAMHRAVPPLWKHALDKVHGVKLQVKVHVDMTTSGPVHRTGEITQLQRYQTVLIRAARGRADIGTLVRTL